MNMTIQVIELCTLFPSIVHIYLRPFVQFCSGFHVLITIVNSMFSAKERVSRTPEQTIPIPERKSSFLQCVGRIFASFISQQRKQLRLQTFLFSLMFHGSIHKEHLKFSFAIETANHWQLSNFKYMTNRS